MVKSSKLVGVLQRQLKAYRDLYQYLVNICHVFRNQQHQRLREITTFILQQLGESINVLLYLTMYLTSLRWMYWWWYFTHQFIRPWCSAILWYYDRSIWIPTYCPYRPVKTSWTRLLWKIITTTNTNRHATPQTILQKQWCMLRGQVDKIPQVT